MIDQPTGSAAALSLTLNRSTYVSNDLVHGTIRITAYQRFECTSILVVALGLETVRWNPDSQLGCSKVRQNVCFKQEIMVSAAERVFECGIHLCTFECILPLVLPGSILLPEVDETTTASVEYRFDAVLEFFPLADNIVSVRHQKRYIRTPQPLHVHETHPEIVPIHRFDEVCGVSMHSCCWHRVVCDMRASISTDTYYQGDHLVVTVEVMSGSLQLMIPDLTFRLLQIVKIRLHSYEQIIEREVGAWQFGPINTTLQTPKMFTLDGLSTDNNLPPSTTNGTVVQCRYAIEIDATLPSGPIVELRLPITLLSSLHRVTNLQ